jgi:hypothetical protein
LPRPGELGAVALIVGGLILQASFYWVFTGLRRHAATPIAYWMAAIGYLSWWLVLGAVIQGLVSPFWLAAATVVPATIVLFGGQIVDRAGWRRDK